MTQVDWTHVFVTLVGAIGTIAAIKADISWLKRWTTEHAEQDRAAFERLEERINRVDS